MTNRSDVGAALRKKIQATEAWLRQSHPDCFYAQKRLIEGTVERAYWHYGYLVAPREIAKLLQNSPEEKN